MFTVTALSGLVLLWSIAVPYRNVAIMVCAGVVFTLSIVVVIRLIMDPRFGARSSVDSMLKLASQTLTCMKGGTDYKARRRFAGCCASTAAIAVAITDKKQILGYAGFEAQEPARQHHPHPRPMPRSRRQAAHPIHARRYRLPQRVVEYQGGHHRAACRRPQRRGHAQVLLSPSEAHQRDAEVHRRRVRQTAVHADGGVGVGRADAVGHAHGAEDAPKPDQSALLVQHHQHHRLAHSHRPRNGAQAAARIRRVLSPNARRLRRSDRVRA